MILLADSGSTKCDWFFTNPAGETLGEYRTIGFNPFFQDSETIAREIAENQELMLIAPAVKHIYYYGAGNSSEYFNDIVRKGLAQIFSNAELHVSHDLNAAAFATYDGRPCISCILGTGSNSCYFDGEKIHEQVPALGYVLGDEGSGAYFGKWLLAAFLYKKLPVYIANDLQQEYGLNKQVIFENVYQKPRPNRYLAGFARFIDKYKDHPEVAPVLHKGMVHFLTEHVLCFPNGREVPVHFVGSVASNFNVALESAAKECGVTIGNIVRRPITRLMEYHVKYIFNK